MQGRLTSSLRITSLNSRLIRDTAMFAMIVRFLCALCPSSCCSFRSCSYCCCCFIVDILLLLLPLPLVAAVVVVAVVVIVDLASSIVA